MGKTSARTCSYEVTRRNSWFQAVEYHAEYFDNYLQFV